MSGSNVKKPADIPAAAAAENTAPRARHNGVNLIVLSADPALIDQLREALAGNHRVWRADDATHAADLVVAAGNASLLVDASLADHDTATLVTRIHQQFPDLPIIVAGRRNDETELAALVSSGTIFRFLHKPASIERIKTFVDATNRRVEERPTEVPAAAPRAETPMPISLRIPDFVSPLAKFDPARVQAFAIRGLAIVAAIGVVYLLASYQPWRGLMSPAPNAETATAAGSPSGKDPAVLKLLDAAGVAFSQGRLIDPPEDNAIALYRSALARDPGNRPALQGLDRVADKLMGVAEKATVDGDFVALANAVDAARSARPDHPRLAFFSAQLEQQRERIAMELSRAPEQVAAATAAANSARAQSLVELSNERIAKGKLVEGNDSALAHLIEARRVDSRNPAVAQGAMALSALLQLRAREAMGAGKTDEAAIWLQHAAALGVDSTRVAALRAEVDKSRQGDSREQRARMLALANQRIAQDRLIEPATDSARHYTDLLRAADPNYPGLAETSALLATRALGEARRLTTDKRIPAAEAMLETAIASGAARADTDAVRSDIAAQQLAATARVPTILQENEMQRLHYVAPRYPNRALNRSIQGWVDVEFIVRADGSTADITVIKGEPSEMFDSAATDAIERWRYQPRMVNGKVIDQRVAMRLRFTLAD